MSNYTVYAKDITDSISMINALEIYGIPVTKGFAPCPFHNEKTPSLKVYPKSFYCFGCGAGGDVITLVRKLFNCDFKEAIEKINTDFALNLPIGEKITLRQADMYRKRQREIEKTRQREQEDAKRRISLQNEYYDLIDKHKRLKDNYEKYRPQMGDTGLHPLFVEACRMLDYIEYKIESFRFGWEADLIQ